jgi:hypothetical protein
MFDDFCGFQAHEDGLEGNQDTWIQEFVIQEL